MPSLLISHLYNTYFLFTDLVYFWHIFLMKYLCQPLDILCAVYTKWKGKDNEPVSIYWIKRKWINECMANTQPWIYQRWVRCQEGVIIPCWPITPASTTAEQLSWNLSDNIWITVVHDRLYQDKLDRYIDHRICKMLPSNATVEFKPPATTTYL